MAVKEKRVTIRENEELKETEVRFVRTMERVRDTLVRRANKKRIAH